MEKKLILLDRPSQFRPVTIEFSILISLWVRRKPSPTVFSRLWSRYIHTTSLLQPVDHIDVHKSAAANLYGELSAVSHLSADLSFCQN
jgi:mannosyltransferase OCH1-like enzyme